MQKNNCPTYFTFFFLVCACVKLSDEYFLKHELWEFNYNETLYVSFRSCSYLGNVLSNVYHIFEKLSFEQPVSVEQ